MEKNLVTSDLFEFAVFELAGDYCIKTNRAVEYEVGLIFKKMCI